MRVRDGELVVPPQVIPLVAEPDRAWCVGENGPMALCGPCRRVKRLPLLDFEDEDKEPWTSSACEVCGVGEKDEK